MSRALFGDICGFLGAAAILSAYAYQTIGKRDPNALYHGLNLLGAVLLTVSLTIHYNLASLCLEFAWGAIALYGLARRWRART